MGGVLFIVERSEWNLGEVRTALNNSRANLLSSLCENVLLQQSRPSVRPPVLLLSHQTSLCRYAAKAILHKSVSPLLSRSHLLTPAAASATGGGGSPPWRSFLRKQEGQFPM